MLETEHLASLRVNSRHYVLDGAVLSRRVRSLKNQQERIAIGRIEKLLLCTKMRDMRFKQFAIMLLGLIDRLNHRGKFAQVDIVPLISPKVFGMDFHLFPFEQWEAAARAIVA